MNISGTCQPTEKVRSYVPILDPSGNRRINRGPLNDYDACLLRERMEWDQVIEGGLRTVCCPRGRKKYNSPPWITMPREGRRFKPVGILPVSSFGGVAGTQTALTMTVDTGYDGVLTDIVCEVVADGATGFIEGGGDVIWRLQNNQHYVRDLGNIQVTMGSLTSPGVVPRGGVRIFSRNVLTFLVSIDASGLANLSPGARIVTSLSGWMYPR
jgi:hypothetical protein